MKKKFLILTSLVLLFLGIVANVNAAPIIGVYTDIGDGEWREYWMGKDGTPGSGETGNLLYARDTVPNNPAGFLYIENSLDLIQILSVESYTDYTLYITEYSKGSLQLGSDIWDTTDTTRWYNSNDVTAYVYSKHYLNGTIESKIELFGTFNLFSSISYIATADVIFNGSTTGGNVNSPNNPAWGNTDDIPYVYGKLENVNVTITPEPATLLLLGFGLLGVAGVSRRNRKA